MKKTIACILLTFILYIAFAQNTSSLYRITTRQQADIVLKAISTEVNLTNDEFSQLRDLLYASASGQEEISKQPGGNTQQTIESIVIRQTLHIEENMKNLIGADKFKLYQTKKAAIEKRAQTISLKN